MEKISKNKDGLITENGRSPGAETLETAKQKGSEYWSLAKKKGKKIWKGTEDTRGKALGRAKGFIQKHPAQAMGYAVLAGSLVTILFYLKAKE